MKVLIAHNRYMSSAPSGENQVVDFEIEMLRSQGVDVCALIEESDSLNGSGPITYAKAALGAIRHPDGLRRFKAMIRSDRPDIVHLHNVYPLISPAVILAATKSDLPIVMTMHNYRLSCVKGTHYRDTGVCTECFGRSVPWPAMRHSCYRNSASQTAVISAGHVLSKHSWMSISRFIALTPFMGKHLSRLGVPPSRIAIRPTAVPDPGESPPPGRDLLFIGRLDNSKGIELLLDAWDQINSHDERTLIIAGSGPIQGVVAERCKYMPSTRYIGPLDATGVRSEMMKAGAVLLPSRWFEGFPRVIAEAWSVGRAVVGTRIGSISTIIDPAVGWLVDDRPNAWEVALSHLSDGELHRRGREARKRYLAECSPAASAAKLLGIYRSVLDGA